MIRKFFVIVNFILIILSVSGCACFQFEEKVLNSARNSIGIIKTTTFLRITETSSVGSMSVDSSTAALKIDIITSFNSVGSGSIVRHKGKVSFVLTAAHVCKVVYDQQIASIFPFYNPKRFNVMSSNVNEIYDITGKKYSAKPLLWNKQYDVCLMVTKRIDQPALSFAIDPPRHGQKIYYLGFPRGLGGGTFIPIFEGFYIGKRKLEEWRRNVWVAGYTVPIAPGSSGSAVINAEGGLVGMVHSYYSKFDHIGLGATHDQLVDLFDRGEKYWDERKEEFLKEMGIE
jgi:S1-C subfamily serine protease